MTAIDPSIRVLIYLVAMLVAAKIGAEIFERVKLPAVLGELVAGVLLGNIILVNPGWTFFEPIRTSTLSDHAAIGVDLLARIGIIILLFEVGLESSVSEMRNVGTTSFLVAAFGVIGSFILGCLVSVGLIHEVPKNILAIAPGFDVRYIHIFVGATLCATSVGITARVFEDMGRIQMKEARVVLGAAVIDDVLALIMLATVTAAVVSAESGTKMSFLSICGTAIAAIGFLAGAVVLGTFIAPRFIKVAAKFKTHGLMLVSALVICFGLSALAGLSGLAPIVGAFSAGLILEEIHFKDFASDITIKRLVQPVATIFVPLFFVEMGVQVHLESLFAPAVLLIAGGLTIAAILGKQLCGLAIRGKEISRITVGIGMVPRGEVELIFASIGRGLGIFNDAIFSAVVLMVVITTFVTPPLLKWAIGKQRP